MHELFGVVDRIANALVSEVRVRAENVVKRIIRREHAQYALDRDARSSDRWTPPMRAGFVTMPGATTVSTGSFIVLHLAWFVAHVCSVMRHSIAQESPTTAPELQKRIRYSVAAHARIDSAWMP